MKRLKKLPLAVWCYTVYFIVWVLVGAVLCIADAVSLTAPQSLTPADFELYGLEVQADGSLLVTDGDPQMILTREGVRTISYTLQSGGKGTVCAYYTKAAGQDWSNRQCLWPAFGRTDGAQYVFPYGTAAVRLDISSVQGDTLVLSSITLNAFPGVPHYFVPSALGIAAFLVLPGLFAAAAAFCRDAFRLYFKKESEV